MTAPYFTIVIPTYNRAHLIEATLKSVFSQKFNDYEVIIIDDGSNDRTGEIIRNITDPRIRYEYQENRERGAARNKGIDLAGGQYITFCDSDDLLFPDYLLNAYEIIQKKGDVKWMHLAYEIRRPAGKPIPMRIREKKIIPELARGNPLSCMGVFVSTSILRENQFNENRHLSGSEDWELWLRLAANYQITVDRRISSALILHDERSVIHTSELKLQLRKYLSIGYAFDDKKVKEIFTPYFKVMNAYFDTYISLHLLLAGKNRRGMVYLIRAFTTLPSCILERRFLAILKLMVANLFR